MRVGRVPGSSLLCGGVDPRPQCIDVNHISNFFYPCHTTLVVMPFLRHASTLAVARIVRCMNMHDDGDKGDGRRLLTPGQVAELLAVPASTLSRWRCERRELPYVTVGRVVRYRQRDVDAWIEENLVMPDD